MLDTNIPAHAKLDHVRGRHRMVLFETRNLLVRMLGNDDRSVKASGDLGSLPHSSLAQDDGERLCPLCNYSLLRGSFGISHPRNASWLRDCRNT